MPDTDTATADSTTDDAASQTSADDSTATDSTDSATDAAALGDAGKKALDAMKAERKTARDEAAAAKAERDALQAKLDGREAEHAAEQSARETERSAFHKGILRAELRGAAKGKLTDPSDVFRFPEHVDLSAFEVGEDGAVDTDALERAVDNLISKRPDLAVQDGKRFQGGADGGTRNESGKSIDDQIAAAQAAGDFQTVIALKQQRAAESRAKS